MSNFENQSGREYIDIEASSSFRRESRYLDEHLIESEFGDDMDNLVNAWVKLGSRKFKKIFKLFNNPRKREKEKDPFIQDALRAVEKLQEKLGFTETDVETLLAIIEFNAAQKEDQEITSTQRARKTLRKVGTLMGSSIGVAKVTGSASSVALGGLAAAGITAGLAPAAFVAGGTFCLSAAAVYGWRLAAAELFRKAERKELSANARRKFSDKDLKQSTETGLHILQVHVRDRLRKTNLQTLTEFKNEFLSNGNDSREREVALKREAKLVKAQIRQNTELSDDDKRLLKDEIDALVTHFVTENSTLGHMISEITEEETRRKEQSEKGIGKKKGALRTHGEAFGLTLGTKFLYRIPVISQILAAYGGSKFGELSYRAMGFENRYARQLAKVAGAATMVGTTLLGGGLEDLKELRDIVDQEIDRVDSLDEAQEALRNVGSKILEPLKETFGFVSSKISPTASVPQEAPPVAPTPPEPVLRPEPEIDTKAEEARIASQRAIEEVNRITERDISVGIDSLDGFSDEEIQRLVDLSENNETAKDILRQGELSGNIDSEKLRAAMIADFQKEHSLLGKQLKVEVEIKTEEGQSMVDGEIKVELSGKSALDQILRRVVTERFLEEHEAGHKLTAEEATQVETTIANIRNGILKPDFNLKNVPGFGDLSDIATWENGKLVISDFGKFDAIFGAVVQHVQGIEDLTERNAPAFVDNSRIVETASDFSREPMVEEAEARVFAQTADEVLGHGSVVETHVGDEEDTGNLSVKPFPEAPDQTVSLHVEDGKVDQIGETHLPVGEEIPFDVAHREELLHAISEIMKPTETPIPEPVPATQPKGIVPPTEMVVPESAQTQAPEPGASEAAPVDAARVFPVLDSQLEQLSDVENTFKLALGYSEGSVHMFTQHDFELVRGLEETFHLIHRPELGVGAFSGIYHGVEFFLNPDPRDGQIRIIINESSPLTEQGIYFGKVTLDEVTHVPDLLPEIMKLEHVMGDIVENDEVKNMPIRDLLKPLPEGTDSQLIEFKKIILGYIAKYPGEIKPGYTVGMSLERVIVDVVRKGTTEQFLEKLKELFPDRFPNAVG